MGLGFGVKTPFCYVTSSCANAISSLFVFSLGCRLFALTNALLSGTIGPFPPLAALAQLVEQWTENPRVSSSNLLGGIVLTPQFFL